MARVSPLSQGQLVGTIVELDLARALARVQIGEIESDWLPWVSPRAGSTRIWSPPSIGEQVVVLSPDGDIEAAVILGAIFCDAAPQNANAEVETITFKDGSTVSYDPATAALFVALTQGASVTITADGGITLTGPVTITGDVDITGDVGVTGKVTASDDVVASGKSLKSHRHLGVQAGAAQSGIPA